MKARRVAGGLQRPDRSGQPAGRFHPCALGRGVQGAARSGMRSGQPPPDRQARNCPPASRTSRRPVGSASHWRKPRRPGNHPMTPHADTRSVRRPGGADPRARATGAPTAAPPRPHPAGPGEAPAALQDHPFSSDTLRPRDIAPPAVTRPDVGTPCGLRALCVSGGLPRSTGTLVPYSGDALQSSARGGCSAAHPCLTPDLSTGVSTAP